MTSLASGLATTGWLALRETADARSRSVELAAAAGALLRETVAPVVHDLGSGTGSYARWLAPHVPADTRWVLHDRDPLLLEAALAHPPSAQDGVPAEVAVGIGELRDVQALHGASLVTASALLDVLTRRDVAHLVSLLSAAGVPALLALTVTGRVHLRPADPIDDLVQQAFNDHQRRCVDGARLLGPDAAKVVTTMAQRRMRVSHRHTPWVLGPGNGPLLRAWFEGWVHAALEHSPALGHRLRGYRDQRQRQLDAGCLQARVDHVDLLLRPR